MFYKDQTYYSPIIDEEVIFQNLVEQKNWNCPSVKSYICISVVTIPPLYSSEVHIFTKYFSVCLFEPSFGKWCVKTSIATCRTLLHPHTQTIRIVSQSSGSSAVPGSLGFSHPAPGWPHHSPGYCSTIQ